MLHFPVLRTRRLTVQLRELSIGESIAIAAMPPQLDEAACTAFLRHAVESVQGIDDPAHWTVQERMLSVCHYLAAVAEDGPDFSLGAGRYSDYLDGAHDIESTEPVEVGEVGDDVWRVRHLTGAMAESIERMSGEVAGVSGRLHWLLGGMAAQLVRAGEQVPDAAAGEGAFDEFLVERMRIFSAFPESDFAALLGLYLIGRDRLRHLFLIDFDERGLVARPREGAAVDLPSARFPARACLGGIVRELVGGHDESGL